MQTITNVPDAARAYLASGLCVLPAKRAEKRPAVGRWKQYQQRLPTAAEVSAWCKNSPDGVCLVCGAVSGNLELIDFDMGGEAFDAWRQQIPDYLLAELVIERSPSGGRHVVYRCTKPINGNMKLAQRLVDGKPVVLIETRGEGGLFLCAPTPGYELVQGDLANVPVITAGEREVLLEAAWGLNEYEPHSGDCPSDNAMVGQRSPLSVGQCGFLPEMGARPGDDYNHRGDVRTLLRAHGWTLVKGGDNEHWRRPGKDSGTSATLKDGVFYVFSSNAAPFESDRGYDPFGVYATLEHRGDHASATRALGQQGYGRGDTRDSCVDISAILAQAQSVGGMQEDAAVSGVQPPEFQITITWPNELQYKPPEWLIRGVLERDAFAQMFGDVGNGKSFMAIDWACRIATGTPWRGKEVKKGPVIYICGEGQNGFGRRLKAWEEHNGVPLGEARLGMVPAIAMTDAVHLKALVDAIARQLGRAPALIVLDTVARCFGGGDENSTSDMNKFVAACDAIRQLYRCTVLAVHHVGHGDKSRARGAIALKAALDSEYRVEKDGRQMTLTPTKLKDAELPAPVAMELVTVDLPDMFDEDGEHVTSAALSMEGVDDSAIMDQAKRTARQPRKHTDSQTVILALAARIKNEDDEVNLNLLRQQAKLAKVDDPGRVIKQLEGRGDLITLSKDTLALA